MEKGRIKCDVAGSEKAMCGDGDEEESDDIK